MSQTEITPAQWHTLIDDLDRATFGELVDAVGNDNGIEADPKAAVEKAIDEDDCLVVDDEASGMFDVFAVDDDRADTKYTLKESANDQNPDQAGESDEEEPDLPDVKREETDKLTADAQERTLEAFEAAVEFFHAHVDDDLSVLECVEYDTPREAYREGRGWDDDTIDEKLLGWAPASGNALLDHLMGEGFDREAILGTGLFWDNLSPIWEGRFVVPYFDADGRPTFAISRRAGDGHPADGAGDYGDGPSKYHKVPVSAIDECKLDEPIYGIPSVEPGESVLIAEGVADAITAHQEGYPCLSPVTTSFKLGDRERLAEILDEADVPRAYIVNDSEPATTSLQDADEGDGWERLHIEQYGEGVRGAVRTASHLADDGIDARIGELPRPSGEKVDLDDYLGRWNGDLDPVLARARPADDHPAHDPQQQAIRDAIASGGFDADDDHQEDSGSRSGSALYDLGIREVADLDWGYRGPSPLGHHGESENYFVLVEDLGLAYDYKYKKAYTPLTYLLADAGERDPSRPNGTLDDGEILAAWLHAKHENLLPSDDPIPRRALQHLAREFADWDGDLVEHSTADGETFEGLPTDAYNAALEAVEEHHGLDHGRHPSGGVGSNAREHRALLPPVIRDLSTATSGWDWRHAAEHGEDDLILKAKDTCT